jgi:hypothetical protein
MVPLLRAAFDYIITGNKGFYITIPIMETSIFILFLLLLTLWFLVEGNSGNLEFGREINKVWLRIVPTKNRTWGSAE